MSEQDDNIWVTLLDRMRPTMDSDEYRRWFSHSYLASDAGDQISIWVPGMPEVRHLTMHYLERIYRELEEMERRHVTVRFIATGYEDEETDWEE